MPDLKMPSSSGEEELSIVQNYMGTEMPGFVFRYIDDAGITHSAEFPLNPPQLVAIIRLLSEGEHHILHVASMALAQISKGDAAPIPPKVYDTKIIQFGKKD